MPVNNQDALMAAAYKRAEREGEVRVLCGTDSEPYQMRFRFYSFLKRVRRGAANIPADVASKTLELQTRFMIVVEGRYFVLKDRADTVGMQGLNDLLAGDVETADKKIEADVLRIAGHLQHDLGLEVTTEKSARKLPYDVE